MLYSKFHSVCFGRFFRSFLVASLFHILLTSFLPDQALAKGSTFLGWEGDWAIHEAMMDGAKTCYTLAQPQKQSPQNVRRDPVHFFVSIRPKEKIRNQVSVNIGYPFDTSKPASILIGKDEFVLFTERETGWIDDPKRQDSLVAAMKRGNEMIVKGVSKRGTQTEDTYSLKGITAAIAKAVQACR